MYIIKLGVGMLSLFKKILNFILDLQGKSSKGNVSGMVDSYKNSTTKVVFRKNDSATFSSLTDKNRERLEFEVKNILKKYQNSPDELLNFVERKGTKVYRIPFAKQILKKIKYEEGFIVGLRGLSALYLNIVTTVLSNEKIKLSFKTKPMFVIGLHTDDFTIIQHFHKWYASKLKLPGFEQATQDNIQKFLNVPSSQVDKLSIDEIMDLKEAISRERESIDFVVSLARATKGSKNALQKLTTGGASV